MQPQPPYHLHNRPADLDRFAKLTDAHRQALAAIVGETHVHTDSQTLRDYGHDWTEDYSFPPDAVVKPASTEEVAAILRYCNEHNLPVTPAGARTGLSGGMLPVYGGVLLALERMNQILDLDTRSQQITVQPGVINQHVQDAADAVGLYYPPDPSSKGSSFIGGNVAHNAGGGHAVKYGITGAYVLALEAVLPSGEVIRTGAKTLKNSTGYNLTQLLVGSEGTLAVITEITLKLVPKPTVVRTLLAPFPTAEAACQAVSGIFQAGITPAALEFMEKDAVDLGQQFLNIQRYDTTGIGGHLLLEFDGRSEERVLADCEAVLPVLEAHGAQEVLFADSAEEQAELWRIRRCLGEAVKRDTIYKEEDTVVPRAELAAVLRKVKELGQQVGFRSVCYGHAGDGNLHVNILKDELSDTVWDVELPKAIQQLFEFVVSLGGTISGEHGIGWVQRPYLPARYSQPELTLLKGIKQLFDPQGILNPGKIFLS